MYRHLREFYIDCIRTEEEFRSLREEWNRLLDYSWSNYIFLTWEWMYTWWQMFKGDSSLMIITIKEKDRKKDKLVCIAPFKRTVVKYYEVLPVARIEFIGTGEAKEDAVGSKYLDVIVQKKWRPYLKDTVLDMLFEYVLKEEIWDEIILENLREDSITLKFLKEGWVKDDDDVREQVIASKEWTRYLKLPDSWDRFMASLFQPRRYRIKRTLKALEGLGEIQFKVVETEKELDQTFKELVELQQQENRAFKIKPDMGIFSSTGFHQFHSTIVRPLFRAGNLVMARLSINGELYGVIYNICWGKTVSFYQLAVKKGLYQPNKMISPGACMHIFAIKKAIERRCKEYDFLVDDERAIYAAHWVATIRQIFDVMLIRKRDFKIYTDSLARIHKEDWWVK